VAIYTDFFVASEEELRSAFPHRFPVAKRPKTRKATHPITGEPLAVKEWGPAEPFPELPKAVRYPSKAEAKAVSRLPHAQFKSIDQLKLATLQAILTGGDALGLMEGLCHPALMAPGDENSGLFRLPKSWVEAVAGIEKAGPVAKTWAATDECQADNLTARDAAEVVEALRDLAEMSLAEAKGMFLWVNV
jgi:hypothetical protein